MTEIQPEINIEELKNAIREAVARREAEGRTAFIKASAELFEVLSAEHLSDTRKLSARGEFSAAELAPLKLQPEFVARDDDHYHVDDLLKYHDIEFIWNAYRALLKREPDEAGFRTYLEKLRTGRFNKIDVLASLRYSPEGQRNAVTVDGLRVPALVRRLYRLPVIGYFTELGIGLTRLPSLIRHQRQVEGYLIAQQQRTADHLNSLHESLSLALTEGATEQKQIAAVLHQQLTALFREQSALTQRTSRNGKNDGSVIENTSSKRAAVDLDELHASFQDRFRGDVDDVTQNLKVYLPLLQEAGITDEILDLGCGRGEWLELLRAARLQGRGVESNRILIKRGRTQNLEVIEADAIEYVRGLADQCLKAVTAFHFVEHLELEKLIELLADIRRTLKPGGLIIFETPNPKNLVVGACNFYSDPTHRQPLFPESLEFLLQQTGFVRTRIQYLHPVEGSPFINRDAASQALNSWFFSARDYAVIGWKI